MSHIFSRKRISFAVTVFSVCMLLQPCTAKAGPISFIILNRYSVSMKIGDTCRLLAVSSDNSIPKFKSSKSSVASVNTYGRITAKSAGTAVITAKTKNAAASCRITVNKTQITLNQNSVRLERNGQFHLKAFTSNGSKVTFRTNKKSVASVSDEGVITGQKPGEAKITVTADRTSVVCLVTVQKPSVHLDQTYLSLYRCGRRRILATVSSGVPVWPK